MSSALQSVCDVLVNKQCLCLVGRNWLVLIAAAHYAQQVLHTTACCAIATVHDLLQTAHVPPTPTLVLKILCANYVKHQMRTFFLPRFRRERSRSPPSACERLCERLCDRELDSSPELPDTLDEPMGGTHGPNQEPEEPNGQELNEEPEQEPASVQATNIGLLQELELQEREQEPEQEPLQEPEEEPALMPAGSEPSQSCPADLSKDFIPLEDHADPPDHVGRGAELLQLMARVVRFFNMDNPDDGAGWMQHAERFPELQDMVIAFKQWRRVREILCSMTDEAPVREFEVAVAALVSFIDCSIHEDEGDEEDEEDEEEEDDDDASEAYELCCDTSSDDEETKEVERACARDPCYTYLHTLGARVTPASYKHLTRFRTAFADQPDHNAVNLRDVCLSMLQNLDCVCLDEEPMLHAWVDATEHALIHMGSDKCDVIVASRAFFTLERRWPTLTELQEYVGRQRMQSGDPERFYREERFAVPTPNLHRLVPTPALIDSDCSICGHLVSSGSSCYLLSCGHQFHAADCLDTDTILNWLSTNRRCPVCRVEVSL